MRVQVWLERRAESGRGQVIVKGDKPRKRAREVRSLSVRRFLGRRVELFGLSSSPASRDSVFVISCPKRTYSRCARAQTPIWAREGMEPCGLSRELCFALPIPAAEAATERRPSTYLRKRFPSQDFFGVGLAEVGAGEAAGGAFVLGDTALLGAGGRAAGVGAGAGDADAGKRCHGSFAGRPTIPAICSGVLDLLSIEAR